MSVLLFLLFGAAPQKPVGPKELKAPVASNETRCVSCHQVSGWHQVSFAHERTGFPLRGAHTRIDCRSCHADKIETPIARTCSGCHRDPHVGEFGQLCEGCHQETGWQSRFSVDAHRGTMFPLSGAHSALPCQECHTQMRDRVFAKTATTCSTCHVKDFVAAATTSIDHAAAGFSDQCQSCHSTVRFTPARFPAHDACFALSGTAHAAIGCRQCHSQLVGATASGACSTNTAACSGCHTHECARTDQIHAQVPGYQCKDVKCYECHRFSRTGR